jgi:alpha-beta hydrolase superfamily lysophospholipase
MEAVQPGNGSVHSFDFESGQGHCLQAYAWMPGGEQLASVIIVHGLGEHARRYAHVAEALNREGIAVFAWDQRGHGATADKLGDFGSGGWPAMLADLRAMVEKVRAEQAGPVFILGHSMGSMLTHQFLTLHSSEVDGAVLSGSPGFASTLQISALLMLARFERLRLGREGQSALIRKLIFGTANRRFETEGDTGFEWLTRVMSEVQKYAEDPLCGATPTCGSVISWFAGYRKALKKSAIEGIRKDLPLYLFSGLEDPMHNGLKNLERQFNSYQAAGLKVDRNIYNKGRHEMLNERNSERVIADLLQWLKQQIGKA